MIRTKILLLFFFAAFTLGAQDKALIPVHAWPDYQRAVQRTDKFVQDNKDVFIDPIEVPIEPTAAAVAAGNWAYDYFGISQVENEVSKRLTGTVVVVVYGTAGKINHAALPSVRNDLGKSFTGEAPDDGNGHETHVAGCIGAVDPNNEIKLGTAGLLSKVNKLIIIPVKVLTNEGWGDYKKHVKPGLEYGEQIGKSWMAQGAKVIHSLSMGGGNDDPDIAALVKRIRDAGMLVNIAAGNNGAATISFPGKAPGANCVAALNNANGDRASYSNYGPQMYIGSPGSLILSTYLNNTYKQMSGTSMATPCFTGIEALAWSMYPTATANQIEWLMSKTTRDLPPNGWDQFTGWGSSLISKILSTDPLQYPNTPVQAPTTPTPPDITRESRKLSFVLPEYATIWKTTNSNAINNLSVTMTVSFTTNKLDTAAYSQIKKASDVFFTNRGFMLSPDWGFVDATYWVRHFYEMLVKQQNGIDVKIEAITGRDKQGRIALPGDRKPIGASSLKLLKKEAKAWTFQRAPLAVVDGDHYPSWVLK